MEDKVVQNQICCLLVSFGRIWLGRGTNKKTGEQGIFTGPGGVVLPNFVAEQEVARYCESDMNVTPKSCKKVAEVLHVMPGNSFDVVLHVYEVPDIGRFPADTNRITDVQYILLDKLPLNEMACWAPFIPRFLNGKQPTYLRYVLENGASALTSIDCVKSQPAPV